MPFTPPNSVNFIVRSTEYGDGSEYEVSQISSKTSFVPDHYVKRLFRRRALAVGDSVTVQFTSSDKDDPSVLFSTLEAKGVLHVKKGGYGESDTDIAKVEWTGKGKGIDKSNMSLDGKSGRVKDILTKSGPFSQSRCFVNPETNKKYKWKMHWIGNDPVYPEATFRALYEDGDPNPVATTERLSSFDGSRKDEAYPLYLDERGLEVQHLVVATLVVLERLDAADS